MSLILITGGSRSGKSAFAQEMAEQIREERCFIATCPPHTDPEMDERIFRHQQDRQGRGWQSIEETLFPDKAVESCSPDATILLDCLTLWVNNLMYQAEQQNKKLEEDRIAELSRQLGRAALSRPGTVIMVTNEVGLGIVPDNPVARRYRDLVGRCNQIIASSADQVFLVTCGIPLQLK